MTHAIAIEWSQGLRDCRRPCARVSPAQVGDSSHFGRSALPHAALAPAWDGTRSAAATQCASSIHSSPASDGLQPELANTLDYAELRRPPAAQADAPSGSEAAAEHARQAHRGAAGEMGLGCLAARAQNFRKTCRVVCVVRFSCLLVSLSPCAGAAVVLTFTRESGKSHFRLDG